jgi:hypothetical protein
MGRVGLSIRSGALTMKMPFHFPAVFPRPPGNLSRASFTFIWRRFSFDSMFSTWVSGRHSRFSPSAPAKKLHFN